VNLRTARTCYDHLAGEVAVAIYDFLLREAWIVPDGSALTPVGEAQFARSGIFAGREPAQGMLRMSGLERAAFPSRWRRRGCIVAAWSAKRLVHPDAGISRSEYHPDRQARAEAALPSAAVAGS
jgi:hypothetical protein